MSRSQLLLGPRSRQDSTVHLEKRRLPILWHCLFHTPHSCILLLGQLSTRGPRTPVFVLPLLRLHAAVHLGHHNLQIRTPKPYPLDDTNKLCLSSSRLRRGRERSLSSLKASTMSSQQSQPNLRLTSEWPQKRLPALRRPRLTKAQLLLQMDCTSEMSSVRSGPSTYRRHR